VIERFDVPLEMRVEPTALNNRVYCVIPTYRAASTILDVVEEALKHADVIIVVDDACPQHSGELVRREYHGNAQVQVIERERNGGVGAATKTGIGAALEQDAMLS
jgi:dolichol-phosphate mannosyltransferase